MSFLGRDVVDPQSSARFPFSFSGFLWVCNWISRSYQYKAEVHPSASPFLKTWPRFVFLWCFALKHRSKPSLAAFVGCLMPMMLGFCFLCPSMDCLWHKYHYCPECHEKVSIVVIPPMDCLCGVNIPSLNVWLLQLIVIIVMFMCRLPILRNQTPVLWWILHIGRRRALHCLDSMVILLLAFGLASSAEL